MPNAAIVVTALTDHSAHPYGIFVGGLDVVSEPGQGRYGVVWSSVHITEAFPGGVSSMEFEIDDPFALITIADDARVLAYDFTRDLPMFLGWVQSVASGPAFGQRGRGISVIAYGIEAILDQVIVPEYTAFASDVLMTETVALQAIAAYAPVRAFVSSTGVSTQATPIEQNIYALLNFPGGQNAVLDGLSIRQAYEAYLAKCVGFDDPTRVSLRPTLTVDFWEGLRKNVITASGLNFMPSDYVTITVTEALGSAGASLSWQRDLSPGTTVTAVYVKGGNAAGTGWVSGEGSPRSEAYISDSGILDEAGKQAAAASIISRKGTPAGRGTIDLEDFTPVNAHPGGMIVITSTAMGWAAKQFVISQIDKSFTATTQNWRITFYDYTNDQPAVGSASAMSEIKVRTRGAPD